MHRLGSAPIALAAFAAAAFAQPATAIEYPWCAQYNGEDGDGGRNCGFVSFEQCMQTVRGMGGFCAPNLFYPSATERPVKPKRKPRND